MSRALPVLGVVIASLLVAGLWAPQSLRAGRSQQVAPATTPEPSPATLPVEWLLPRAIPTRAPQPSLAPALHPREQPRSREAAPGLFWHGDRSGSRVALTFDLDGGPDAPRIVRWLADNQVPATIFAAGIDLDQLAANREALAIAAAHPDLFEIGSHSYSHRSFVGLNAAAILDELDRSSAAIRAASGADPIRYFRPPYGAFDAATLDVLRSSGWVIVMWDVDPKDWRSGATPQSITSTVVNGAQGGSVVVLHLSGRHTLAALPAIVDGLRLKGLQPARVSDLVTGR